MKHLFSLMLVLTFSAAVSAQKVTVQYNKSVDFAKFKTYSWAKGIPARNPIINQMIVDGIEQGLASYGLTKVESGSDLQLVLSVAIEFDLQVNHGGWGNTGSVIQTGVPSGQAWDVRRGTLNLDMLSGASKDLVWHGMASDTLDYAPTTDFSKDAQRVEKKVKKAVDKLLKKYPRKT